MKYISLNTFVNDYREQLPFTSFSTIREHVIEDMKGKNVLKVKVLRRKTGKGLTGMRYYIPVSNIEKFLENLGEPT